MVNKAENENEHFSMFAVGGCGFGRFYYFGSFFFGKDFFSEFDFFLGSIFFSASIFCVSRHSALHI